eukprot:11228314-Lingulodinium_polyedra.AAC.1
MNNEQWLNPRARPPARNRAYVCRARGLEQALEAASLRGPGQIRRGRPTAVRACPTPQQANSTHRIYAVFIALFISPWDSHKFNVLHGMAHCINSMHYMALQW